MDVRADRPFEQRVTVEAAAVLTDLNEPWPYELDGRVDGDCAGRPDGSRRHEFVSRQGGGDFTVVGTPGVHPGPQFASVHRDDADRGHQCREQWSLFAHAPRLEMH